MSDGLKVEVEVDVAGTVLEQLESEDGNEINAALSAVGDAARTKAQTVAREHANKKAEERAEAAREAEAKENGEKEESVNN